MSVLHLRVASRTAALAYRTCTLAIPRARLVILPRVIQMPWGRPEVVSCAGVGRFGGSEWST